MDNKNILNSGDLKSLKLGQTLLTRFRKVANGFISVELAEVKEGNSGVSAAYVFNKSNSKFTRNSARRAWQNGSAEDLESALGVSLGDDAGWTLDENGNEILTVNILNPVVSFEGQEFPMRVQIVESVEADDYRASRVETTAKRKGRDGDFILHNGDYIFTYASIVFTEPSDVFLKADAPVQVAQTEKTEAMVDTVTGEIFS
tara:strand:+ start:3073 stop:3678 length:606 start_codon:yes stop_codon:yes gene_type:complete